MMKLFSLRLLPAIVLLLVAQSSNAQQIKLLEQGKPTSIRGLSVVDDSIAWISGSNGYVAITRNGGKTWDWQQVKGFEKSDFRGIEAFSANEAVIMSSGSPALILKTVDGGNSWQVKYKNEDTAYFFDAISFANKNHGFVLGDPINNKFVLMETTDGGETWRMFNNRPDALPGEAAFAASNTCLRTGANFITITSGGSKSRMISYSKKSNKWEYRPLPIKQGKASQGAFSFAASNKNIVFVGGDYTADQKTDSVASLFNPANNSFQLPATSPAGYQSCVEFISGNTCLSTGTPDSNISSDGGVTWAKIDDASYNVCRKAKKGNLVLLAGDKGKIGVLLLPKRGK